MQECSKQMHPFSEVFSYWAMKQHLCVRVGESMQLMGIFMPTSTIPGIIFQAPELTNASKAIKKLKHNCEQMLYTGNCGCVCPEKGANWKK